VTGLFIAFEGGEGAGKSTQVRALAEVLRDRGHEVVLSREPGGTPVGEHIRSVLLGPGSSGMAARTEALLFAAARAEHVAKLVRPARERGAVVITDRYIDSSIAYQGVGRDLGTSQVSGLSLWGTEGMLADLTIVLDIDPALGLSRAGDPNRMEAEPDEFHTRVRQAFLDLAAQDPRRYLVVDASQSQSQVGAQIAEFVLDLVGQVRP
jgi:dTMP kinase